MPCDSRGGLTLSVAIIADDLTGALDSSAPFAEAGLSVAVAIDAQHAAQALATGAEVVAVNTASRGLAAEEAAARAGDAARTLRAAAPCFVLKKVDSRLKGNPGPESRAVRQMFGFPHSLVLPAIPEQGRYVRDGQVTGHGIEAPISIAGRFGAESAAITAPDARSDADIDRLVREWDPSRRLGVCARGLAGGLARKLRRIGPCPGPLPPDESCLFAIGSRDPITTAQIAMVEQHAPHCAIADAPGGRFPSPLTRLPALIRCTGSMAEPQDRVARRFGATMARMVEETRPAMLVMSGGDTALAILRCLGVKVVCPQGEVAPGMPCFQPGGGRLHCVVKSGGFGDAGSLLRLLPNLTS